MTASVPFWRRKAMTELSAAEWESLCDGCARCCLVKLEDDDTGEVFYTDVVCRLLDRNTCRCTDYPNRQTRVPTCVALTPGNIAALEWMPGTCSYRVLAETGDLPSWHPLVTGDPDSTVKAGMSVRGRVVSEEGIDDDVLEHRLVDWVSNG